MKEVNAFEVHDGVAHIYCFGEELCENIEYFTDTINDSIADENVHAVCLHYSGLLLSNTFIMNEGYDCDPDNIMLDYLFEHIPNLTICLNLSMCNEDEAASVKECIADSKLATAENIKFADEEWTIVYG